MPDTSVRYFDSSMTDAPALSGSAGSLITVLDACLVNGFGAVTLTSLVVASNVATATVSGGHNLAMVGEVGPVVRIEGATPAGLNGDWRVTVTSSSVFTFATTGISDQTASGTISAKRAPAGFEKAFTGTNKAAYRSLNAAGTQLYLRIDDTGTTSATATMYEAMSDIDTGVNPASVTWTKGSSQPWGIFADDRALYLLTSDTNGMFFGDIASVLDPDPYGALLLGSAVGGGMTYLGYLNNTDQSWMARTWTGIGAAVAASRQSLTIDYDYLGYAGAPFPNGADHAFHAWPVQVWERGGIRGTMPGLWNPLHPATALLHLLTVPLRVAETDRTGLIWVFSSASACFDLTGPWR